jgi:uncharacterized protein YecA (UPF0149 family)
MFYQETMKARLAEEAARQEEKRLQEEARERERQRVEKEKVAMLEALRLHQEKQEMLAAKLQAPILFSIVLFPCLCAVILC